MPKITEHVRLYLYEGNNEGSWIKSPEIYFEFQVNPSSIQIANEVSIIESNYLRRDGGIARPTQRRLKKITGNGKFFDIPLTPITFNSTQNVSDNNIQDISLKENSDQFPLISRRKSKIRGAVDIITAFDMYNDLLEFMRLRRIFRMVHQFFGEIYVVIQNLTINNTSSENTLDFSFAFLETLIDDITSTGFERDANKQTPGMAISSITDEEDTIQFKEYKVVSGDTLSSIALKFYNNSSKWGLIYDYNRDVLVRGPNFLQIGWTLKIPISESAEYKFSNGSVPSVKYSDKSNGTDEIIIDGLGYSIDTSRYPDFQQKRIDSLGILFEKGSNALSESVKSTIDTFNSVFPTIYTIQVEPESMLQASISKEEGFISQ